MEYVVLYVAENNTLAIVEDCNGKPVVTENRAFAEKVAKLYRDRYNVPASVEWAFGTTVAIAA